MRSVVVRSPSRCLSHLTAGLEQALQWLDVLLVGRGAMLPRVSTVRSFHSGGHGRRYGLARRRLSAILKLLHQERAQASARPLRRPPSGWCAFAAPIYALMAIYAPAIIGDHSVMVSRRASMLVVLCIGSPDHHGWQHSLAALHEVGALGGRP